MDVFDFVKKWEGGVSRNPADSAAADPVPGIYNGKTGWHTNKGVTWTTFKSLSQKLGYSATPELFFLMPDDIWKKIAKNGYWDPFMLDTLPKTRVAYCIFTWAWGSGVGGAARELTKFQKNKMGILINNNTHAEIVANFKTSFMSDEQLFGMLCDEREAFFRGLNKPQFLQGWLNRLNDFRRTFK